MFLNIKSIFILLGVFFYYLWLKHFKDTVEGGNWVLFFFMVFWMVGVTLMFWGVDFSWKFSGKTNILEPLIMTTLFMILLKNMFFLEEAYLMSFWDTTHSKVPYTLMVLILEILILMMF